MKNCAKSIVMLLAYPDPILSPNSPKRHWRLKQPAKETARTEAMYKSSSLRGVFKKTDILQIALTFHPPTAAKRDLDNAYASMKSAVDGVFKGLGLDDSQIREARLKWGAVTKGGAVALELTEMR